jgi:hypothetical protein
MVFELPGLFFEWSGVTGCFSAILLLVSVLVLGAPSPPRCRRHEHSTAARSAEGAPCSLDDPSRMLETRTTSVFQRRAPNITRTTRITTDVSYQLCGRHKKTGDQGTFGAGRMSLYACVDTS